MKASLDFSKEPFLTLRKWQSCRQPPTDTIDADYADERSILTDSIDGATKLLHSLEESEAFVFVFRN